eukprot:TRINITY_DN2486_c0_g1_i1.p1 TRINITY_DN2486_c0_g1~~TRINITY_DN2486_c0_g1_i1.p1  ORF type:complete len:223 (-),score=51.51 TRINITY_DN2486_c0_g1_i1:99-767(-)
MATSEYPSAKVEDFDHFVKLADAQEGWTSVVDEEDTKVWEQTVDGSSINIIKVWAHLKGIDPNLLYDVLHDPVYRGVWDDKRIEAYVVETIDHANEVGYYSAKLPMPCSNRDWVNQRSWMTRDGEWIIINHSVVHPKAPVRSGIVRAKSILTGYLVRSSPEGSYFVYMTQNDPGGWVPAWMTNSLTRSFAPSVIKNLAKACKGYNDWKAKNDPQHKPWLRKS